MIFRLTICILLSVTYLKAQASKKKNGQKVTRYQLFYASSEGLVDFINPCQKNCTNGVSRLGTGQLIELIEEDYGFEASPNLKSKGTQ